MNRAASAFSASSRVSQKMSHAWPVKEKGTPDSREISIAVRDEIRVRKLATADADQQYHNLRVARARLRRLREEYGIHVAEHGCVPRDGIAAATNGAG